MSSHKRDAELGAEMSGAKFGDVRLSRRLSKVVDALSQAPGRSLPALFDDAGLEAAYRFFNNESVTPEAILLPHIEKTVERMRLEPLTLVVHDTSTMQFNPDGARTGLGHIRSLGQGFLAHISIALSGDGSRMPLGTLAMSTVVRTPKTKPTPKAKAEVPNEKNRWGQHVVDVRKSAGGSACIVHLMDREADDYGLFAQLTAAEERFVIRLHHNRQLESSDLGIRKLGDALERIVATAQRAVPLTERKLDKRSPSAKKIHPNRDERLATLAFGATTVTIQRPKNQPTKLAATVTLNVVKVWEPAPPEGQAPISWLLLTTEPVNTPEQLLQITDWYRARWVIEEFFKALKTGCAYQGRQLETFDGLVNVLATFMPIAWRMLRMRIQSRRDPEADAETVLTANMLDALQVATRIKLPKKPNARQALLAVAALGGHQKQNGDPGWLTLSRGFEALQMFTLGWCAAQGRAHQDDV